LFFFFPSDMWLLFRFLCILQSQTMIVEEH
jgi:hypothetical protein